MSERKLNIIFIIPGFFYVEEYQKLLYFNDIPLGTLQLSSYLKKNLNIKIDVIDLRLEAETNESLAINDPNEEDFKKGLIKSFEKANIQEFDNIGINCYTSFQYLYTDYIAKVLRKEFPKKIIIVGGYHPTAAPQDFYYENSPYNFIIRGEAESPLLDLFKSGLLNKKDLIPEKKIINSTGNLEVNKLPLPDYELYLDKYPFKNNYKFELYNSRGCPYQCAFCAENYDFRNYNFKTFKKNFEKVSELVEEYNPEFLKIGFADQSFNRLDMNEKILDYLISNNFNEKFTFSCQSRIETISKNLKLLNKFRKCNMIVGYGFEHANETILKEMHKTETPKEYVNNTKRIIKFYKDQNDIYCRLNILVGFPGETIETFNETIEFIEANAIHENVQISPTFFSNYPNVFVYKNMVYFEQKFGTEFIKEWWKLTSNPYKNAVPKKPSKHYFLKDLLYDYKESYSKILGSFKRQAFYELVSWKRFFNKWYNLL